jgi:cell division protein FtsL
VTNQEQNQNQLNSITNLERHQLQFNFAQLRIYNNSPGEHSRCEIIFESVNTEHS